MKGRERASRIGMEGRRGEMCDKVVVKLWPSFALGCTIFALGSRYEACEIFALDND